METHLSDLTVSLRRRRRGNERKARISEIPGAGKGLKIVISACEPLLLPYGITPEQLRAPATSLWRSVADAALCGPDED